MILVMVGWNNGKQWPLASWVLSTISTLYANWLPDRSLPRILWRRYPTIFVPHWRKLAIKRFGHWFRVSKLMDVGTVFKPTVWSQTYSCGPCTVQPHLTEGESAPPQEQRSLLNLPWESIVSIFVCLLSARLSQLVIHGTFIIANIHWSEKEWLNLCHASAIQDLSRLSWMGWWTLRIARRSPHKAGFPKKRCKNRALFSRRNSLVLLQTQVSCAV